MKAIPSTVEALRELARQGEVSLGVELHAMAERVRAVVPELIGLSLGVIQDGITLTLVSSAEQLAALDAVQYLDGGPCAYVAAEGLHEPLEARIDDLLDEDQWRLYAQASSVAGVASSLSLPVIVGGSVVGGVNLYASTADAFHGHHDDVAAAVGSDAVLAVTNADLSFWTMRQALNAPDRVRERGDINIALGLISETQKVNIPIARERLRNAAARAGITEVQAARAIRHVRGQ